MRFWSFIRDMFVFDWFFGHHKKGSCGERQRENNHYTDHLHNDDCHSTNYGGYRQNDYAQQDFDDDLDAGMFDDF